MIICRRCGSSVEDATFCRNCGTALNPAPETSPVTITPLDPLSETVRITDSPLNPAAETVPITVAPLNPSTETVPITTIRLTAPAKKSPIVKILLITGIVLIFVAAGAIAAVYFGVRHLVKSSEANQTAVQALHRSHVAADSLGEILDTGFPSGEISETGASGNASYAMSVKGSKASGTYYATLQKTNGTWSVISGKLQLSNGQSLNLDIHSPDLPSNLAKSEGHQLNSSSVDQSSWRTEYWSQQVMRFSVPVDWIKKKVEQRELDYRKGETYSSTYLAGNGYVYDNPLPAVSLLQTEVQTASEQLHNGIIIGYAVRDVGGATGLLTVTNRGDVRIATWKGLVQAGGKQREIDILFGANIRDFDNLEPTFNAILNSIRFD